MTFSTTVNIPEPPFQIKPCERMLFVGSCFADNIGRRFLDERFPAIVNPYGVMYNPVSVLHTVQCLCSDTQLTAGNAFTTAVLTLGTNHVYIEKATGEVVDNCRKRPQQLFEERQLTVSECADTLRRSVSILHTHHPGIQVILTVSPIRYAKYGFHESQLSKATLLLAIQELLDTLSSTTPPYYFPAYELLLDELRDYRFYKPDMLHPSEQAVDYIWERLVDTCFSAEARQYLREWRPIKEALAHKPFHPESPDYQAFLSKARQQERALADKYPGFT